VQGSQSTARSFGVQGQQLLTESQVFEDEILPGTESADHPVEDMPDRRDHGKNLIGTVQIELFAKSFILWVCDVLARDTFVEAEAALFDGDLDRALASILRTKCSFASGDPSNTGEIGDIHRIPPNLWLVRNEVGGWTAMFPEDY